MCMMHMDGVSYSEASLWTKDAPTFTISPVVPDDKLSSRLMSLKIWGTSDVSGQYQHQCLGADFKQEFFVTGPDKSPTDITGCKFTEDWVSIPNH